MSEALLRERKFAADPHDPWLPELRALETELHHPGVRCSRVRLEALLHPEFHEVGRSGRAYGRDTVIGVLVQQTEPPAVLSDGFAVQRLASDIALLTYRSAHAGAEGPQRRALRSSIWCRTAAAGWQLLYHQGTAVEDTP